MENRLEEMDNRLLKMDEALENLRIETRAANEATARLRQAQKETQHILKKESKDLVDQAIAEAVATGLSSYSKTIHEEIEKATNSVYRRFDEVVNLLVTGKKSGDGSIFGIPGAPRPK